MKYINRVFQSSGQIDVQSVKNKSLRLAILFMVLLLLLTSCGPTLTPRPSEVVTLAPTTASETPAPSETGTPVVEDPVPSEEPLPQPKTMEIDGVTYEMAPLPEFPEPEELDFAAEKKKYQEDEDYSANYLSTVRLISYKEDKVLGYRTEVTARNANKETLKFYPTEYQFYNFFKEYMGEIVNVIWYFDSNAYDENDKELYCCAYDMYIDEATKQDDNFVEGKLTSYKLNSDYDIRITSGVVKLSERIDDLFLVLYVLGEDGYLYDFYYKDTYISLYAGEPGTEVKIEWYIKADRIFFDFGEDDAKGELIPLRRLYEYEVLKEAPSDDYFYSPDGIPYIPGVVIPDHVDLTKEASAEEINTDMESDFISLVKKVDEKPIPLSKYTSYTQFDTVDKNGNTLTFVCTEFAYTTLQKNQATYVIWRNEQLTNIETGKTDIYKFVVGFESHYEINDNTFANGVTTRKLYVSEKKQVEGIFYKLSEGDYQYLNFLDNDGFLYSFFIGGQMDVESLRNLAQGTKIKVSFYEKEIYIWEAGQRLLDRVAVDYTVIK